MKKVENSSKLRLRFPYRPKKQASNVVTDVAVSEAVVEANSEVTSAVVLAAVPSV